MALYKSVYYYYYFFYTPGGIDPRGYYYILLHHLNKCLTAIKHVADDNVVFSRTAHWHIMHANQSDCSTLAHHACKSVRLQHTGTLCMQISQTAGERTLNFTSFDYGLQLNSPEVKPTDYEIQRFNIDNHDNRSKTKLNITAINLFTK